MVGHRARQSTAVAGSGSSPTAVAVDLGCDRVAAGWCRAVVEERRAVVEEHRAAVEERRAAVEERSLGRGRSTGSTCWLRPVHAEHSEWRLVYWLMSVAHLSGGESGKWGV